MVYNMKLREPTSQLDPTELDTYADVIGPFVLPWLKYVIMDNGLYPQNTPPMADAAGTLARRLRSGRGRPVSAAPM